jgi:hypothetical protein
VFLVFPCWRHVRYTQKYSCTCTHICAYSLQSNQIPYIGNSLLEATHHHDVHLTVIRHSLTACRVHTAHVLGQKSDPSFPGRYSWVRFYSVTHRRMSGKCYRVGLVPPRTAGSKCRPRQRRTRHNPSGDFTLQRPKMQGEKFTHARFGVLQTNRNDPSSARPPLPSQP